jgi:hypothetical protein
MSLSTTRWVVSLGVMVALVLAGFASLSGGQDTGVKGKTEHAKKLEQRLEQIEQRLARTEKHLVDVLKALKEQQDKQKGKTGRYQMLNAGRKVVTLDTETGRTTTIEPSTERYIAVTVGTTMFVVDTAFGNVNTYQGKK